MPILGLSFNHFYIAYTDLSGSAVAGSVVSYNGLDSQVQGHFVLCSIDLEKGLIELKSLSSISSYENGIEVGGLFQSIDNSFSFKASAPGILSKNEKNIKEINPVSDVPDSVYKNRHNAIIFDSRGKRWSTNFLSGTKYGVESFDKSFLSVNSISGTKQSYIDLNVPPAILLSKNFVLIKSSDIGYYSDNGISFISGNGEISKNIFLEVSINMSEYLKNINGKISSELGMSLSDVELYKDYCICKIKNPKSINKNNRFVKLAKNINSFKSIQSFDSGLIINPYMEVGLLGLEFSEGLNGIKAIVNYNDINQPGISGSYQGDYVRDVFKKDDSSLLFIDVGGSKVCAGFIYEKDFNYNSGVANVGNRFMAEGKDSFGVFASSLANSGNNFTINKVSFYFDSKFVEITESIMRYLGSSDSLNVESIGVTDEDALSYSNAYSGSSKNNVISIHNFFVGEKTPAIIDGRYSEDPNCDNYVPVSAFLDRNVRPSLSGVNKKGIAAESIGLSFSPDYSRVNTESKSYFLSFNGDLEINIPYVNYLTNEGSRRYFSINEIKTPYLCKNCAGSTNQIASMSFADSSTVENEHVLSYSNGSIFYNRQDGSVSNVIRHNDALVIFSLAMQMLAFVSNNDYSNGSIANQSVVFGFSDYGISGVAGLSLHMWNLNKKTARVNYGNKWHFASHEDRELILLEFSRLVKSIRSFSNISSNTIYMDFLSIIDDYAYKYPNSDILNIKKQIIDSANLICQLPFYATKFGDPDIDVFALINKNGYIDLTSLSDSLSVKESNKRFTGSNISKTVVYASGIDVLVSGGSRPIWSGCSIFSGSIRSHYSFKAPIFYAEDSTNAALTSVINRWINTIDSLSGLISGYIINCRDDICVVEDSEMASRTQVLVESIVKKSRINANGDFTIGVSYSPISVRGLVKSYGSDVSYNYILNSKRIIERIVKPGINAGCRIVMQDLDVDKMIDDAFKNADQVSEASIDAICLLENIYDPDNLNGHSLNNDSGINVSFRPVHVNGSSGSAFMNLEILKGKNYFESREDYLQRTYPLGYEIKDSNVDFDRFNSRRSIVHACQNMISSIINDVIIFVSSYLPYSLVGRSLFIEKPVKMSANTGSKSSNNYYCHNFISNCMISMGSSSVDSVFSHNTVYSPYGSIRNLEINTFANYDNFELKKVFNRKGEDNQCSIERCNVVQYGRIGNSYNLMNNIYFLKSNIKLFGGEGGASSVNDIILRQSSTIQFGNYVEV
jgi:hypothetical protein